MPNTGLNTGTSMSVYSGKNRNVYSGRYHDSGGNFNMNFDWISACKHGVRFRPIFRAII